MGKRSDTEDVVDVEDQIDEEQELDEEQETADEGDESEEKAEEEGEGEETAEEGELVVSIGDEKADEEEEAQRAPDWVRELRKSNREMARQMRRLEDENTKLKGTGRVTSVVVGDKPTMESCDWDAEKYEREYDAWKARESAAKENERAAKDAEERQQAQWQTRIDAVQKAAATLKVADYDEAAETLDTVFTPVQHGILMGGPDDPKTSALLRYALGRNPKKAKELAAISDPVKFTFALARLEAQMKVTTRKPAPPPDKPIRSSVSGAAAVDSTLARLQLEADKTGNRTKVAAYLREKAKKAAAAS